jgi:hypothetical protein
LAQGNNNNKQQRQFLQQQKRTTAIVASQSKDMALHAYCAIFNLYIYNDEMRNIGYMSYLNSRRDEVKLLAILISLVCRRFQL